MASRLAASIECIILIFASGSNDGQIEMIVSSDCRSSGESVSLSESVTHFVSLVRFSLPQFVLLEYVTLFSSNPSPSARYEIPCFPFREIPENKGFLLPVAFIASRL